MNIYFKKYFFLIFLSLCLNYSYSGYTQQVKQDTLTQIINHQKIAEKTIIAYDFDTAITNLNKANKLASASKNDNQKACIYLNYAKLQFILHNYNKAASDVIKAITFFKKTDNKNLLGKAYNLYGIILTKTKQFNEAEKYLQKANIIFVDLNDGKSQAITILSFGYLEQERGSLSSAASHFEAVMPLLEKNKLYYYQALAHIKYSEVLLNLSSSKNNKKIQLAKIELEKALSIIDTYSFHELKIESLKIASQIASTEDSFAEANTLLNLYIQKKDSLYNVYINVISENTEYDSNIRYLNQIIATQQDDIAQKQKSISFVKMTTGLSIALIIILSLLALSLSKNNSFRAKTNGLLRDKNIELTYAKEKAERASHAKAQFLSTITHELRTPLYAVTGLTHLLLEEDPKPNQKEHLNSLKFSGEYLLSLINNILDLNKLEANKVEIDSTSFNLKKRISDVIIALKKTTKDRGNTLTLEYEKGIPANLIGDPLKISQVLINLIGNAVKFTENGKINIRVLKNNSTKDNINLRIEVEDTGVGISKQKQKSIFETFSQGSLQINRKFGGSGLGLSIVKNLLELMNSKIHLESTLGEGSKFWFDIPFSISEPIVNTINAGDISYNIDYAALENVSILVVEDNKINQLITQKILKKNKMLCLVADNGIDAIKMIQKNNFEIILMDIHMPGISGIETTKRIRKFNTQIPIIALTAVTIDENLDEFYKAGFNEIIPKPFKPEEFFEKIYETLMVNKV